MALFLFQKGLLFIVVHLEKPDRPKENQKDWVPACRGEPLLTCMQIFQNTYLFVIVTDWARVGIPLKVSWFTKTFHSYLLLMMPRKWC